MEFDRFFELWDALVTKRIRPLNPLFGTQGMSQATFEALVAYANGDKGPIEDARKFLRTPSFE